MRTLDWYLDKAKELQGIKSDRQLSLIITPSANMVCQYRSNRAYPSAEVMKKLAKQANVPEEIAVADLGYWTHFDTPAASTYKSLAEMATKATGYAAAAVIGVAMNFGSIGSDGGAMASEGGGGGPDPRGTSMEQLAVDPARSINYTQYMTPKSGTSP